MARDALFPDGLVRPKAPYSPVVRSGDHVYTAGQVGFDATGNLVAGGIAEQTRQTLANLEACLAAAGCTLDDVVKVNVFLVDLADFDGVQRGLPRRVRGAVPRRGRRCRPGCPAGSASRSRRSRGSPAPPRDRGRHAGRRRRRRPARAQPRPLAGALRRRRAREPAPRQDAQVRRDRAPAGGARRARHHLPEARRGGGDGRRRDRRHPDPVQPDRRVEARAAGGARPARRRCRERRRRAAARGSLGCGGALARDPRPRRVRHGARPRRRRRRPRRRRRWRGRSRAATGSASAASSRIPSRPGAVAFLAEAETTGAGRRARGRDRLRGRDADDVGLGRAAPDRDRVPGRHVRVPRPRDGGGRRGVTRTRSRSRCAPRSSAARARIGPSSTPGARC